MLLRKAKHIFLKYNYLHLISARRLQYDRYTMNSPIQLRFPIHLRSQLVHFAYSLQTQHNAMRYPTTNIANATQCQQS